MNLTSSSEAAPGIPAASSGMTCWMIRMPWKRHEELAHVRGQPDRGPWCCRARRRRTVSDPACPARCWCQSGRSSTRTGVSWSAAPNRRPAARRPRWSSPLERRSSSRQRRRRPAPARAAEVAAARSDRRGDASESGGGGSAFGSAAGGAGTGAAAAEMVGGAGAGGSAWTLGDSVDATAQAPVAATTASVAANPLARVWVTSGCRMPTKVPC